MRNILILSRSDFSNYYGQELISNLEGVEDIRFGDALNFATNTNFHSNANPRVIEAFNVYLRQLRQTVERIIINL